MNHFRNPKPAPKRSNRESDDTDLTEAPGESMQDFVQADRASRLPKIKLHDEKVANKLKRAKREASLHE